MHVWLAFVHASESCDARPKLARRKQSEARFALDLAVKGELGPGLQADCLAPLINCADPPRERPPKFSRDQLVSHFGWARGQVFKAIVAHLVVLRRELILRKV